MGSLLKQNLSRFKLITFDVTGTLLKLKYSPGVVYERVARQEYGYSGLETKQLDERFRVNFKTLAKEYPNFGEGRLHWSEWWSMLVHRTFKDVSESVIDPKHLKSISDKLIHLYETEECWTPTENAIEFVEAIKDSGRTIGVITNSDPRTETILRNMKFPAFDFVISAYEAKIIKPDPRIFQLALDRTAQDERASEAMHIGNDTELDYKAAINANWTGILIDSNLPKDEPYVNKFKSLGKFLTHLSRTN